MNNSNLKNETLFDVIIVGAGPGGASAAYFLSQAGKKLLVLEKNKLPRYKACGGGVSVKMLAKYFPFSFDPVIDSRPQAIGYTLYDDTVSVNLPEGALGMVMRSEFDAFILKQANATVLQGITIAKVVELTDRVQVESRDGQVFEGRYLIGADGSNSQVAKSLGLRRRQKPIPAIEVETPVPPDVFARFSSQPLFIFSVIRRGYLWIFPKGDHLSVGIAEFKPKPGHLKEILAKAMEKYGISLENGEFHGHTIPLYSSVGRISTRRSLLVGDAAGLVDPLSGEGIRLAIKSAWLAAQVIISGKLPSYHWRVLWEIGISQSLAYPLRVCFYYLTELSFIFGVYNPFASQAFMKLLADEIGYLGVFLRIFGSLPLFFAAEISAGITELIGKAEKADRLRQRVYGEWERKG